MAYISYSVSRVQIRKLGIQIRKIAGYENKTFFPVLKFFEYGMEKLEYDKDHYLKFEIAYHAEPKISDSNKPIFHIHEYSRDFKDRTTRLLTDAEFLRYKKYFKGVVK